MSEFHSDSLVPSRHGVISPFAFFTWCAIVLMVVGVIALFVSKFDFARLRGADHFIGKARQAISAKDWQAAVGAIQHVQGPARERAEFLRVLADFLEATRAEPALLDTTLIKLDGKGLMQPVDFIWACRLRLMSGKIEAARKVFERIPASARQTADVMRLSMELLKEEGHVLEAAEVESQLFEKFTDDPETIVRKAMQDLQGAFPEVQQATAIRLLSQRSDLTLSAAVRLLELADSQSGISAGDRLPIISTLMRLDPLQRDHLLGAEVKRYEKGDALVQTQLASWLAKEKEYDKIMALLPDAMLVKSPVLFPQVAQGLAEQGKWAELMNLVKRGKKLPVSNARAATWRALATKHLQPDNAKEIRAQLEEAIREGNLEKNVLAVMGAARLAEEWAMADLALKAYETLAVPGSAQEADMLENCWRSAATLKDSNVLLKLADKRARLKPANVQMAVQRDYMHLLCGDQLETTLASAPVPAGEPEGEVESDASQLLQALKAYRLNDPALLASALEKVRDARALKTGERAVYAGLLAVNGQTAKAFQLAESIHPELLLDEEAMFLRLAL
ncbi:MAG: hypothetical protein B7Z37_28555 [Verrucomicrobia bacterium 12-59-8]|nr:MAG: hypothetical protein B7Z37_28555 [Verrucomicrobia bacterium 12-59-8]